MVSLDLILGDNFRYDFNYLIDNGYILDLNRILHSLNMKIINLQLKT